MEVKKSIKKAVERSSKLEGLSLSRALKNKKVIERLKKHGKAVSL